MCTSEQEQEQEQEGSVAGHGQQRLPPPAAATLTVTQGRRTRPPSCCRPPAAQVFVTSAGGGDNRRVNEDQDQDRTVLWTTRRVARLDFSAYKRKGSKFSRYRANRRFKFRALPTLASSFAVSVKKYILK